LMRLYVMWFQCMQITCFWGDHGSSIGRQYMIRLEIGILL